MTGKETPSELKNLGENLVDAGALASTEREFSELLRKIDDIKIKLQQLGDRLEYLDKKGHRSPTGTWQHSDLKISGNEFIDKEVLNKLGVFIFTLARIRPDPKYTRTDELTILSRKKRGLPRQSLFSMYFPLQNIEKEFAVANTYFDNNREKIMTIFQTLRPTNADQQALYNFIESFDNGYIKKVLAEWRAVLTEISTKSTEIETK